MAGEQTTYTFVELCSTNWKTEKSSKFLGLRNTEVTNRSFPRAFYPLEKWGGLIPSLSWIAKTTTINKCIRKEQEFQKGHVRSPSGGVPGAEVSQL